MWDLLRPGDTLVVRWLDRLGRNYSDVTDTVREFMRRGVTIKTVINGMTFSGVTKDPMEQAVRDAMICFIARSNDNGTKYRGRKPTFTPEQYWVVSDSLGQGLAVSVIAKTTGVSRQSIYRIRSNPERQLAALAAWYGELTSHQSP